MAADTARMLAILEPELVAVQVCDVDLQCQMVEVDAHCESSPPPLPGQI